MENLRKNKDRHTTRKLDLKVVVAEESIKGEKTPWGVGKCVVGSGLVQNLMVLLNDGVALN